MNKISIASIALLATAATASAQGSMDAYTLSQTDLRGTARFMSMGGAFTALGGDISSMAQNPAGIGVYRRSDIGVTLDISPYSFSAKTDEGPFKSTFTKAYCNNFGYVGATPIGNGTLRSFAWGASYNRISSFDRQFHGTVGSINTSLSNYIAGFTGGTPEYALNTTDKYNPYFDQYGDGYRPDWLSVLAYQAFIINGTPAGVAQNGPDNVDYQGLYGPGTNGYAEFEVRERGYVDEYNIDFGGNLGDVVYWGIGFGITDLNYTRETYYGEGMDNAYIASQGNIENRNTKANYGLSNWKNVSGNGYNVKFGLIAKPINELRIGFAVHTPTWYSLTTNYAGGIEANFKNENLDNVPDNPDFPLDYGNPYHASSSTPVDNVGNTYGLYDWRLRSPWKLMVGLAGIIGNRGIVSIDYERQAYDKAHIKVPAGNYYSSGFVSDDYVNDAIKSTTQAANIIRVGAEYRVTPQFSVRAGYNWTSATCKDEVEGDANFEVNTSGTDPSFSLNNTTQSVSFGLGYRYQMFYIDAAYVYRHRSSTYNAFTNFAGLYSPKADVSETANNIVLTVGLKF